MSDQQERETEEDEGGTSDTEPMLPRRRPTDHHVSVLVRPGWPMLATQGLRTLLLPGRALVGFLFHLLLPGIVFLLVLLPAAAIVYLGFLCHARVHPAPGPRCRALLSDRGSAALIVFGFLSLPPLLVLASAARSLLVRRLRPVLQSSAGTPEPPCPPRCSEERMAGGRPDEEKQLCAWV
ncbi:transmembrane protein 88B [Mesocricetus auratus]|uniref:Transmembrane protein 88B n=1 Tax=Mesocricetus auratus TaxID=10036 RepID=A0ABM2WJH2_MESAU|nr:transmembrane protein 88B [Mesocricetus auratus]XP_040590979.1 transmembrane protein 88B [Mesocricetus auratus]